MYNKKQLSWSYHPVRDWRIPKLDEKGTIENQETGEVLELLGSGIEGCEVIFQAPNGPITESQIWNPIDTDNDGFFKIFHDSSQLCLTERSFPILTLEGM